MIARPLREQIDDKLDELSEDQLLALLHYIEFIEQPSPSTDADQENNPLVGFFSAEPDFAERSETR
jgi:hypothetical protein